MKKILLLIFCVLSSSILLNAMEGAGPAAINPLVILRQAAAIVEPKKTLRLIEVQIQTAAQVQAMDQKKLNQLIGDCIQIINTIPVIKISINGTSTSDEQAQVNFNLKNELYFLRLTLIQTNKIYLGGNRSIELFNLYQTLKQRFDKISIRPNIQLFPHTVRKAQEIINQIQEKTEILWRAIV